MITERTLKRWRKESLLAESSIRSSVKTDDNWTEPVLNRHEACGLYNRILQMTQELMDQHLLRRER